VAKNHRSSRLFVGPRLAALVLVAAVAARLDIRAVERGISRLRAGGGAGPPVAFGFDPAFQEFLEDVRARTPSDSVVRIEAPKTELHIYQASYQLAPRRVLAAGVSGEVDWIGTYGGAASPEGALAVRHGVLRRGR
jgi:hypothetical protein